MSELSWLFVALLAVWAGIGLYVLSIAVRQKHLERRLDSLIDARDKSLTNAQSSRSEAK